MKRELALVIGLIITAYNQSSAAELTAETTADIRCLLAVSSLPTLNNQTRLFSEQTAQNNSTISLLYFFGRLRGRAPQLDLENAILAEASTMSQQEFPSELVRCGGEIFEAGVELEEIGRSMVRRSREMQN